MAIRLGSHDRDVAPDAIDALLAELRRLADAAAGRLVDDKGEAPFSPLAPDEPLSVSAVQRALADAGFLPGARIDGICGYRTRAAIRLFQEHVRTIDARPCTPDGIVGPRTGAELQRWIAERRRADWYPRLAARPKRSSAGPPAGPSDARSDDPSAAAGDGAADDAAFDDWLDFLRAHKARRLREPGPLLAAVDAFADDSDTRKVTDWRHADDEVHLVGVRRTGTDAASRAANLFDDVLVLLVRGLVFKFQGSTDPGHTSHPDGAPFLVPGQHDFRFGLHRGTYHALRPLRFATHGVLVVRSKDDYALDAADLERGLEINGTINVHWGGKGGRRRVSRWSEGCQVIAGSGYENHAGTLIDCSDHVAINDGAVRDPDGKRTRGAYNVLADLVVALSNDLPNPGRVAYTLVEESDLERHPRLARRLAHSRAAANRLMDAL